MRLMIARFYGQHTTHLVSETFRAIAIEIAGPTDNDAALQYSARLAPKQGRLRQEQAAVDRNGSQANCLFSELRRR